MLLIFRRPMPFLRYLRLMISPLRHISLMLRHADATLPAFMPLRLLRLLSRAMLLFYDNTFRRHTLPPPSRLMPLLRADTLFRHYLRAEQATIDIITLPPLRRLILMPLRDDYRGRFIFAYAARHASRALRFMLLLLPSTLLIPSRYDARLRPPCYATLPRDAALIA